MLRVLVDTGPLVALFDVDDRDHGRVVEYLKSFSGELGTTWAVVTEVTHLLDFSADCQIEFLRWIESGGVLVADFAATDLAGISELMGKYPDVPMDFADATLVYVAQATDTRQILTLDDDFHVYRLKGKETFVSVL